MNWFLHRVAALWVRCRVLPEDAAARLRERSKPVCYVLERHSGIDLAVLQSVCERMHLPRPRKRLLHRRSELRSFFYLTRLRGTLERLEVADRHTVVQPVPQPSQHPLEEADEGMGVIGRDLMGITGRLTQRRAPGELLLAHQLHRGVADRAGPQHPSNHHASVR